jgi:hypothetical protein
MDPESMIDDPYPQRCTRVCDKFTVCSCFVMMALVDPNPASYPYLMGAFFPYTLERAQRRSQQRQLSR